MVAVPSEKRHSHAESILLQRILKSWMEAMLHTKTELDCPVQESQIM